MGSHLEDVPQAFQVWLHVDGVALIQHDALKSRDAADAVARSLVKRLPGASAGVYEIRSVTRIPAEQNASATPSESADQGPKP